MLACPQCRTSFAAGRCGCRGDWTETGGVQDLYIAAAEAGENVSITESLRAFYEDHAENAYRPDESAASLAAESRSSDRADRVADAILTLPRKQLRVLDAGCGQGRRVNRLALAGHDVVGIDLAFAPLLRAEAMRRRVGVVAASFVRGNLFRPPISEGAVDVVLATQVLDETGNPAAATAGLATTLRPRGWFVASVGAYRLPWFAGSHQPRMATTPERSTHSLDEVCGWLDAAGIDPVTANDAGDPTGILGAAGRMGSGLRLLRSFAWTARGAPGSILVAGTKRG